MRGGGYKERKNGAYIFFFPLPNHIQSEVNRTMAIFKVVVNRSGRAIGKATVNKVENYLKFTTDNDGNKLPRSKYVTALNADSEDFAFSCRENAAKFGAHKSYDDVKYKHYIQGFAPEDCERMTEKQCHDLGVELAKTVWGSFPVLIVTHTDQVSEDGSYHWHNHFIVSNCNVTNGQRLNTSGAELRAQKRFVAVQADENGLSGRGLVLEDGQIRQSQSGSRISLTEHHQGVRYSHDERRIAEHNTLTQKAELRLAIKTAARCTSNLRDYKTYLRDVYGVETRESHGHIAYLHPDRVNEKNAWIRDRNLGYAYGKEILDYGFEKHAIRADNRTGAVGEQRTAESSRAGNDKQRDTGAVGEVGYASAYSRAERLYAELFGAASRTEREGTSSFGEQADREQLTVSRRV